MRRMDMEGSLAGTAGSIATLLLLDQGYEYSTLGQWHISTFRDRVPCSRRATYYNNVQIPPHPFMNQLVYLQMV